MSEKSDEFHKKNIEKVRNAKAEHDKLRYRWIELRKSYEDHPRTFAPIQKGFIFTKELCPVCGCELNNTVVEKSNTSQVADFKPIHFKQRELYACAKCGYEYAYEEGDGFN